MSPVRLAEPPASGEEEILSFPWQPTEKQASEALRYTHMFLPVLLLQGPHDALQSHLLLVCPHIVHLTAKPYLRSLLLVSLPIRLDREILKLLLRWGGERPGEGQGKVSRAAYSHTWCELFHPPALDTAAFRKAVYTVMKRIGCEIHICKITAHRLLINYKGKILTF